jgi:hypothetical protein
MRHLVCHELGSPELAARLVGDGAPGRPARAWRGGGGPDGLLGQFGHADPIVGSRRAEEVFSRSSTIRAGSISVHDRQAREDHDVS